MHHIFPYQLAAQLVLASIRARKKPAHWTASDLAAFAPEFTPGSNRIVLKTSQGHTSTTAVALDQEEWPEVVGTIAGDDTILVVAPDAATAAALREKLMQYVRPL